MSRWTHYVQRAAEVVGAYTGGSPLAPVLKEYFRERHQMGSTDRRCVSDLVYGFYRLGHAARSLPVEERLLLAYYHTKGISPLIEALRPEWIVQPPPLSFADIFPWAGHLSAGIDSAALTAAHLRQPEFYIRIRPGYGDIVREGLNEKGLSYEEAGGDALRLPTGSAVQDVLIPDMAYVVQDLSSQRVRTLLYQVFQELALPAPRVWDACAGSGGKSLLVKDILPGTKLTVSDIRPSILHNLNKRFDAAGIRYERTFVADLSQPLPWTASYDLVLADIPCTGSGTWSRTPEQLYFFQEPTIVEYAHLQQAILRNILPAIRPGGFLLLVTCSVFAEENEANVAMLKGEGFVLKSQTLFVGYGEGSDTLFGALLQRPRGV